MPAIGKSKAKVYSKTTTAKKKEVRGEVGRGPITAKKKKEKKYASKFSDTQAKAKKAMTSDKAYALPFGETFRQAKAKGDKTFRWKSKSYHTKTKDELETGSKEKERFDRAAKSKKVPNNQSNWNKFKNSKTLAEFFGKLKK